MTIVDVVGAVVTATVTAAELLPSNVLEPR
jgi:hypothetical protein